MPAILRRRKLISIKPERKNAVTYRTYHCQPEGQEQHQEAKSKDQPHREEELRKREGRF